MNLITIICVYRGTTLSDFLTFLAQLNFLKLQYKIEWICDVRVNSDVE